jgi:CheY-like chemotaxis protein
MSHEIRTPLNSVIGFAELALEETGDPEAMKERLSKIKSSADTLLDIINGILDISKIESGKLELEKIPFDLRETLNTCKSILSAQAQEKGISLGFNPDPLIAACLVGDPVKLRQVLLNLLSNAVKFTGRGFVELTADVVEKRDDSMTVRFEVKDSGIGMNGEQMKDIFSAFVQSDISTTRKYGGTGLGLAISKSYVELMGGILYAESVPGVGSKFSFELEFGVAEAGVRMPGSSALVLEKPVFSGKVLVCEDSRENQEVITAHLSKVGLDVVLAENGLQGIQCAQSHMEAGKAFDLILMDIHMPVMDGMEAAAKLIQMGTATPIIAITANIMPEDREGYLSAGMKDCLIKPFKQRDLWACLAKYLTPLNRPGPVDTAIGIENSAGDETLYKKILQNFRDKQWEVHDQIAKAVLERDYVNAHMLAHKEGSLAAVIGAQRLAQILRGLEKTFKESGGAGNYPHELMCSYGEELEGVLRYISNFNN